jgi:hypothetical protein
MCFRFDLKHAYESTSQEVLAKALRRRMLGRGRHFKCLLILLTRYPRSTPAFSGIKGITVSMPAPDTHDRIGQVPRARCRRISNNAPFLAHRNDVNGVAPSDRSSAKHLVML